MMIALIAVITVAVPPMAFAVEGGFEDSVVNSVKNMKNNTGKMIKDLPVLTFSDESVQKAESFSENLNAEIISITQAIDSVEGKILKIGVKPLQGHLVYHAKVFSDDVITHVIIDAGNGDVLHITVGKTIAEIEELRAERKELRTEKKLQRLDSKISKLEEKLSDSTGNEELDSLKQQVLDKLIELKEALENDSSDLIPELKNQLKDLRSQINEIRRG